MAAHANLAQRVVAAAAQHDAAALEARLFAHFPAATVHDGGADAVIEAEAFEVAHAFVGGESAAAVALAFVESDLGHGLRRQQDCGGGEGGFCL